MSEPVMVGGAPTAPRNRRALILLGVAAVVAVLALLLPRVLFGEDVPADDLGGAVAPAPVGVDLEGDLADDVVVEPARTFEVFSTKNPFTPLIDTTPVSAVTPAAPGTVAEGVAPALPAGGSAPAPVAVTPAPTGDATSTGPAAIVVTPAAPAGGVATEPVSSQRVALLEIFVDDDGVTVASVRVNDTVHEVAEGVTFASRYKAVALSVADSCGQFLYGDNSFRLCEGEELLK